MIFFALSVNITPGPSLIMFSFLTLLIVLASGAEIRLSNARRRAETQSLEPWFSWTLSSQHNVIAGLTLLIIIRKVRWPRGRSILISGHSVIAFPLYPYQPQPETPYHPLYPLVHLSHSQARLSAWLSCSAGRHSAPDRRPMRKQTPENIAYDAKFRSSLRFHFPHTYLINPSPLPQFPVTI